MHGAYLARLLNIPKVLIPQNPGILSAIGMIMADVIKDYSFTIMKNELDVTKEELSDLFRGLEERGTEERRGVMKGRIEEGGKERESIDEERDRRMLKESW